jgi:cytochrome P450
MITAQEAGEGLSESELLANAIFLFVAGHETTIGLLGNGILALLRYPDQLARLRDDAALAESAVEELLRYDGSQQTIFFTVAEEVAWGDRLIKPGETVLIMVGAVNRDPARFSDPDRLDIARADNRHLAFSHGIHYCLGAPLARAQAQIAIPALFQRFPDLALAGEPTWQKTMFIRGLKSLPARVS